MYTVDKETIGQHLVNVVDDEARIIAMVCPWNDRTEETANLMAAAPDLLKACQDSKKAIAALRFPNGDPALISEALATLNIALEKAGKQ